MVQTYETMEAGYHSLKMNTERLAKGMYIVHFKAGKEAMCFRMVVDR